MIISCERVHLFPFTAHWHRFYSEGRAEHFDSLQVVAFGATARDRQGRIKLNNRISYDKLISLLNALSRWNLEGYLMCIIQCIICNLLFPSNRNKTIFARFLSFCFSRLHALTIFFCFVGSVLFFVSSFPFFLFGSVGDAIIIHVVSVAHKNFNNTHKSAKRFDKKKLKWEFDIFHRFSSHSGTV